MVSLYVVWGIIFAVAIIFGVLFNKLKPIFETMQYSFKVLIPSVFAGLIVALSISEGQINWNDFYSTLTVLAVALFIVVYWGDWYKTKEVIYHSSLKKFKKSRKPTRQKNTNSESSIFSMLQKAPMEKVYRGMAFFSAILLSFCLVSAFVILRMAGNDIRLGFQFMTTLASISVILLIFYFGKWLEEGDKKLKKVVKK
jgi:hypothetical protein